MLGLELMGGIRVHFSKRIKNMIHTKRRGTEFKDVLLRLRKSWENQ